MMLKREFASDVEIPASWFSVLNSLFIVIFAPVFQNLGISLNPSGPIKFAIGLILLGLGFGFVLWGIRDSTRRKYSKRKYFLVNYGIFISYFR